MELKLSKALFVVPLLVASSVAQAGSISYSGSVALQNTELSNVSVSPSLQKFDPALGVLNSVVISFAGNGNSTVTASNSAAANTSGTYDYQVNVEFSLSSADSGVNGLLGPLTFTASTIHGNGGPLSPGQSQSTGALSYGDGSSATFTTSADLAKFLGPGALDFAILTQTSLDSHSKGGNMTVGQLTMAEGQVTITYNYTVPEPSSVLMLGLAGGIVAAGSRLRKRRA